MYNKTLTIALSLSLIIHLSILGVSFFESKPATKVLERSSIFVNLYDEGGHGAVVEGHDSKDVSILNADVSIALLPSDVSYRDYILSVKRRIEERWLYSGSAFTHGEKGVTTIRFSISSSGDLVDYTIVSSSGFPVLDRTALDVICSAAPFGPFPSHIKISQINVVAEFYYGI
ncbi:MAG: energy transducer TonB [Syntrophales bacterium]|nr:energy transducer TonB [Syntrophales bacterium]